MKTDSTWVKTLLLSVGMICISSYAWSKRVICVDTANDGYVSNHEGYERANPQPGDVFDTSGNLAACLAQLADGDQLIIIAHGNNRGTGFKWGGIVYTGFGNGPGQFPVPPNFAGLDNVNVKFCSCWSARDPDGPDGANESLTEKIKDAMGGTGNTSSGFVNLAEVGVCASISCTEETTDAEVAAAEAALDNDSWTNNPPANRPGASPNQQTAAQALVDAAIGPNKCTVTIVYNKVPQDVIDPVEIAEIIEELTDALDNLFNFNFMVGCACPLGDNGLSFVYVEGAPLTETVEMLSPVFPGNGVWRCEDPIITNENQVRVQTNDPYGPAIRFHFNNSHPLPPPGGNAMVSVNGTAYLTLSMNGGDSYQSYSAPVFGMVNLSTPLIPINLGGGIYTNIEFLQMQIMGGTLPPEIFLQKNPGMPASGMIAAVPIEASTSWAVDSYFDIPWIINFWGSPMTSCAPSRTHLHCPAPSEGCPNTNAANYDECALQDAGTCTVPIGGCTYEGAENYSPGATSDDGSCVYSNVCPADLTGDGTTNTSDLLLFLAAFGLPCIQ